MRVQAGSGSSNHPDAYQAGRTAAAAAAGPLRGQPPRLVIVFTTDHYDQAAVLQGVRSITGAASLIGCCGGGVITDAGILLSGVGVLALHIDDLEVALAIEPGLSTEPERAIERLVERLEEQSGPATGDRRQTAIFLADGLTGPLTMDEALVSATAALGPLCPLFGGAAGDSLQYNRTSLFVNDCILNDAVAVALLSTGVPIGIGVRHGWTPMRQRLVITRSEHNVIYELDGRPALDVYRDYFPDQEITIANFREVSRYHPIGFPQANGEWLVRLPLSAGDDGSISCLGSLPSHAVAHIMQGDPASLLNAAEFAASRAVAVLPARKAAAAIVIDCVTRPPLLGDKTATEITRIRDVLGHETPMIGMYSFGEFAADGAPVAFHNKTIAICAIGATR